MNIEDILHRMTDTAVVDAIKTTFASAMAKLKSGMDLGPGHTVEITSSEAAILWRFISKQ